MTDTPKKTIVVIDDEPGLLRLYEKLLRMEGLEVHAFSQHLAADAWLNTPGNKADVILTDNDINIQNYTGLQWVEKLRAGDSAHKDTPVIIASSSANLYDAISVGAQMLLSKPMENDVIIAAVKSELLREGTVRPRSIAPRGPMDHATRDDDDDKTPSR